MDSADTQSLPPSPSKTRTTVSPFNAWVTKNLDPTVGVPSSAFNFGASGPPKDCRVLLLCIITESKADSATAQGLDLRTRDGVVALFKSVLQLTPTTLVRASVRHWVFEVPKDYPHEKLRSGVFGLSQSVGFVVLRPDRTTLRTIEGFVANYWATDATKVKSMMEKDPLIEEIVETELETVSA
jgi:hypothetical protein